MTLQECYDSIGSDYNNTVAHMCGKESLLEKFVRKFAEDPTYNMLVSSYESKDLETAFRMAHTLKGVCLNLGFTKLLESSSALTEALRHKEAIADNVEELYEQVKKDYGMTISAIKQI